MSFLTERKSATAVLAANENALRESEARFRELADNISQFAWTADAKGWIYWYNKRWLDYTGMSLEDMQGWGWQKVRHPEHVNRVVQLIRQRFETGTPWEDTFPLRSKDGTYRWFLSRALPIRNAAPQSNPADANSVYALVTMGAWNPDGRVQTVEDAGPPARQPESSNLSERFIERGNTTTVRVGLYLD